MTIRWRALPGALLLAGGLLVTPLVPAEAQGTGALRIDENFRREPNGVVLARLSPGTRVQLLATEGNWTQVALEGYVWLRSLQRSEQADFDLVVSESGGENLREGPSGTILGRLEEGALLTELSRDEAWARVSRVGWVWSASLDVAVAPGPGDPAGPGGAAPAGAEPTAAEPAAAGAGGAGGEGSARAPGGFARLGALAGPILTAPDGDTLAVARPSSDLQVLRREGNWARVRLEGWVWLPTAAEEGADAAEPEALEPADLTREPEGYVGRVVSWSLQYISLERAEAVRTDFFEGEPFLLTRYGGGDGPFVYVAVPAELLGDVEGLVPLERVSVTGRVRTGASSLTGAPIVDLIEVERSREDW